MQWLTFSKNNFFFLFFIFGYIFGVILYDFIDTSFDFTYVDELMALFLLLFVIITCFERKSIKGLQPLIVTSGIFAFYTVYSFAIQSNVPPAIIQDAIIQYKPYLAFFSVVFLRPSLNKSQKMFLLVISILGAAFLLAVALLDYQTEFFGHPSRYATASVITAFIFFYCSSFDWKDICCFFIIIGLSILSARSKSYGFAFISIAYIALVKLGFKFRFSIFSLALIGLLLIGTMYVAWDKINFYFLLSASGEREMYARPALYYVSGLIFFDFFPFGSGFGSYATFSSAAYYSPLYTEYGLNYIYGLSKEFPSFITDTFFPSLAEFGIVGVILFIYFWIWIIKKGNRLKKQNSKYYAFTLLIICFFFIESIADLTFTHNRGMFMLILLGMVLTSSSITASTKS